MTNFESLLETLAEHRVAFIVIGGAAAIAHGSARFTQDLDIVYQRFPDNIDRLVGALAGSRPYLRGVPRGLPFLWDRATVSRGLNFTLVTSLGELDLFGEIPGGGTYEDLLVGAMRLPLFGKETLCLSRAQLVRAKRAAGRPKDLETLAELKTIEEEGLG